MNKDFTISDNEINLYNEILESPNYYDDDLDNNEIGNEINKLQEKNELENGLNIRTSQKPTNDSEQKENPEGDKLNINVSLTDYQNNFDIINSDNENYFFPHLRFNEYFKNEINESNLFESPIFEYGKYDSNNLENKMNKIEEKNEIENKIEISIKTIQKPANNLEEKDRPETNKSIINGSLINNEIQFKEKETQNIMEIEKETKASNKTNNSGQNKTASMYNYSNILRKCKRFFLRSVFLFINNKIIEYKNGNIGKRIVINQLQKLKKKQISNTKIEFNKELLNKKIKEIFSDEISPKYSNYHLDHNKHLIQSLINENDINPKNYFTKLFNLTFFQCLEHYRGSKNYEELNGMKLFNEEIFNEDEDVENLDIVLNNFEKILQNKKSRKPKESKKIEE